MRKLVADVKSKTLLSILTLNETNITAIFQKGADNNWEFYPQTKLIISSGKAAKTETQTYQLTYKEETIPDYGPNDFRPKTYVSFQKMKYILTDYLETKDSALLTNLKYIFEGEVKNEASLTSLINFIYYNSHFEKRTISEKFLETQLNLFQDPDLAVFAEIFRLAIPPKPSLRSFPIVFNKSKSAFENPRVIIKVVSDYTVNGTKYDPVPVMSAKFLFSKLFQEDYSKFYNINKQSGYYLQKGFLQIHRIFTAFTQNPTYLKKITGQQS